MIRGASITVRVPEAGELDRFGNPVESYGAVTVDDVLIAPGSTELLEASRPEGETIECTLEIPKACTLDLEGCLVDLPGRWAAGNPYRVVGLPVPYMDENTPTRWDREVGVTSAHG